MSMSEINVIYNHILNNLNSRQNADINFAQLMADWQNSLIDAWESTLEQDKENYDHPPAGQTQESESKQFDMDQAAMQASVNQANSTVQTSTGQVSNDQNSVQQCVTAMGYLPQMLQYLAGVIKTKL
jgi:DNA anti-recombination protein RmuC